MDDGHVTAATDGTRPDPGTLIHLDSLPNLRDIGGYSVPGGSVRTGVLYRSVALDRLTPADAGVLEGFGIRTVFDLRTEPERSAEPDRVPPGTAHVVADVLADMKLALPARLSDLFDDPVRTRSDEDYALDGVPGTGSDVVGSEVQVPYDVSRLDYFDALREAFDADITALSADEVAAGGLSSFDTLVVTDMDGLPHESTVSRDAYVAAVRALDRLLLSGFYVVPLFYIPDQWLAHDVSLKRPAGVPLLGPSIEIWWRERG